MVGVLCYMANVVLCRARETLLIEYAVGSSCKIPDSGCAQNVRVESLSIFFIVKFSGALNFNLKLNTVKSSVKPYFPDFSRGCPECFTYSTLYIHTEVSDIIDIVYNREFLYFWNGGSTTVSTPPEENSMIRNPA